MFKFIVLFTSEANAFCSLIFDGMRIWTIHNMVLSFRRPHCGRDGNDIDAILYKAKLKNVSFLCYEMKTVKALRVLHQNDRSPVKRKHFIFIYNTFEIPESNRDITNIKIRERRMGIS